MAAVTKNLAPDSSTDANFRAWGKAISDQFAAGGWTKTSDTTQINWATVTAPTAANQVRGYETWSSNDGGGSTGLSNFYVKIEYGSHASSAAGAGVWITIGWNGTDGAGALSGTTTVRKALPSSGGTSTTLYPSNLSAGAGWVTVAMFTGFAGRIIFFCIERTRNPNNSKRDEVLFVSSDTDIQSVVFSKTEGLSTAQNAPYGIGFINPTNAIASNLCGLCLVFGQKGGLNAPSQCVYGISNSVYTSPQSTVSIDSYGETHTYIVNAVSGCVFTSSPSINTLISRFD